MLKNHWISTKRYLIKLNHKKIKIIYTAYLIDDFNLRRKVSLNARNKG